MRRFAPPRTCSKARPATSRPSPSSTRERARNDGGKMDPIDGAARRRRVAAPRSRRRRGSSSALEAALSTVAGRAVMTLADRRVSLGRGSDSRGIAVVFCSPAAAQDGDGVVAEGGVHLQLRQVHRVASGRPAGAGAVRRLCAGRHRHRRRARAAVKGRQLSGAAIGVSRVSSTGISAGLPPPVCGGRRRPRKRRGS